MLADFSGIQKTNILLCLCYNHRQLVIINVVYAITVAAIIKISLANLNKLQIFKEQSSDLGDSCHNEEEEVYDGGEFMNSDDDYEDIDDDDDVDGDPQQLKLLEAQGWHYRYRKSGTNSKDVFFPLESYSSKLKNGPKNPECWSRASLSSLVFVAINILSSFINLE